MLSHNYSYQECLDDSKKVAWKEDDVFAGKNFDFSKRFLPNRFSGVDNITCLNDNEKRQLNQIMGNAYCHIFAFVEEFIIPMVTQTALEDIHGEEVRLRSLLRFAEEELKHQELFRRSMALFDQGFGARCGLIPGREDVAKVVLSKSRLAALYLTTVIEWFTQLHYVEHVRDGSGLDELFRDLLRFHSMEEAQHAKLDTLLIDEIAETATLEERETAVDEPRGWSSYRRVTIAADQAEHRDSAERDWPEVHGGRERGDFDEDPPRLEMDFPGIGIGASQRCQTHQRVD